MQLKRKNNTTINTDDKKKTMWRKFERLAKRIMKE